jgi:uroporphyrinogen decarboxylase
LKYISQLCDAMNSGLQPQNSIPVIVFAKGAFFARKEMGTMNCNVIGLDWNMDIAESRNLVGAEKTLQGNMDPCLLYSDFSTIKKETEKMLRAFGPVKHIANLGHGLYPDIEKDKVKCFIDTVKNFKH